jgi:phage terminase small subunit
MGKLTPKQKIFCEQYILDWNGTRAAIAAGYSEKTARSTAVENLTKPNIHQYISEVQNDLEKLLKISRAKVLAEHMKLAFSSIAHLHNTWIERKDFDKLTSEQKDCIQEISTKVVKALIDETPHEVEYVKIKLYDKQKALDSISKMLGYEAPEKKEIKHSGTLSVDYTKMSDEELAAIIQ